MLIQAIDDDAGERPEQERWNCPASQIQAQQQVPSRSAYIRASSSPSS